LPPNLYPLIDQIVQNYHSRSEAIGTAIVHDSFPVLFFGNLDGYLSSHPRILTVARNPSVKEFSESGNNFRRWENGQEIYQLFNSVNRIWSTEDKDMYIDSLCNYFSLNYNEWFTRCFNHLLQGMRQDYRPSESDQNPIHTDFCSTLTTTEKWSELPHSLRKDLRNNERGLWFKLEKKLNPDILLTALSREEDSDLFEDSLVAHFRAKREKKFPLRVFHPVRSRTHYVELWKGSSRNKVKWLIDAKQAIFDRGASGNQKSK